MRQIIKKFRDEFFSKLDEKPSWGTNSIKELFVITLVNTLLGAEDEKDSK